MTCHRCAPFGLCVCGQLVELAEAPAPEPDDLDGEVFYVADDEASKFRSEEWCIR